MVDNLFLLAVGAIGWGLSLATYRLIAERNGWPLGAVQLEAPAIPLMIGLTSLLIGVMFAAARGPLHGGLVILLFGLALGLFWSGFLRVAAQSALILAPLAAIALLLAWVVQALV